MKKALLFIVLTFLLLFVSCGERKEADFSALGNTPGNIRISGDVAEDENYIFFTAYEPEGSPILLSPFRIYKMNKEDGIIKTIDKGHIADFLNISGESIYYRNGSPGFVYKMNKNGGFRRPVILKQTTNVIISGDRIYYRLTPCDGIFLKIEQYADDWGSIYSCDLNGRDTKLISQEEILRFVVDVDTIYYADHTDGDSLWKMDTSGENKTKIYSGSASVPDFDDKYLYFTGADGNSLFRMDKERLQPELLSDERFAFIVLSGDWIYYEEPYPSETLGRISKDGKKTEILFTEDVSLHGVAKDLIIITKNDKEDGTYYRFNVETKELTKLSD